MFLALWFHIHTNIKITIAHIKTLWGIFSYGLLSKILIVIYSCPKHDNYHFVIYIIYIQYSLLLYYYFLRKYIYIYTFLHKKESCIKFLLPFYLVPRLFLNGSRCDGVCCSSISIAQLPGKMSYCPVNLKRCDCT